MNKNWIKKINAIAKQVKGGANGITSQEWNFIINSLAEQANNNTTGVSESFYLIEKLEDFVKDLMNGEISFNVIVLKGRNLEDRLILIETDAENFKQEIRNYIDLENSLQDQEIILKASIEYVDGRFLVVNQDIQTLSEYVDQIVDGTVVVKKAEQDKNGNDIVDTYETKSDSNLKVPKTRTIIGIDLEDDISLTEFRNALGTATQSVSGLMSTVDKLILDGLVTLLHDDDENTIVNTIAELMNVFQNYPEGTDIFAVLAGKVDKVLGKGLSTNDFTDAEKVQVAASETHRTTLGNPHQTSFEEILGKPTTVAGLGLTDVFTKDEVTNMVAPYDQAIAEAQASIVTMEQSVEDVLAALTVVYDL